jgi:5-methylcytosine-specific restriction endonuclease McrA
MTRSFAVVPSSIWGDDSFTSLRPGAQWLYLLLTSQRELTPGAILPTLPRRWASFARDASQPEVLGWLDELQDAGWAYTDHDDQETFVSGRFEAERIALQPRRVVGAVDAIARIGPEWLRAIASAELGALLSDAPSLPAPRGVRAAVLERDGFRCRKCGWKPGDPIPLAKSGGRPVYRTLEIDHVWPKSRGGPDEEANFQVLCTTCNASKGARV